MAALRRLDRRPNELLLFNFEPNDQLASEIHSVVAEWAEDQVTAKEAGVIDDRASELRKPPPQKVLEKVRGWMRRYITLCRADRRLPELPEKWSQSLANRRADTMAVKKVVREKKKAAGTLYHHKHDLAPTQEELTHMTFAGWIGDQRIDADVLHALEAGMSVALYLPTGARGSELKQMHLQSIGFEVIQHSESGIEFGCLKLTAFETKTKEHHLNQLLPHSDPWRCGVGLFGLSMLVRVKEHGAPPFTMTTDSNSWKIIGTNVATLDRRLKDVFSVAGIRRQDGDPLTYLGRHFGTRLLQHAGGSAEGGAARRGHSNGTASFSYTECPLPDLLKLAGNFSDARVFLPAHQHSDLRPMCDEILALLFPALDANEAALRSRQLEVDRMRGKSTKVRREEQLNDRERLARSLRVACRTALCCIVARPRSWRQWAICESETTLWQRANQPSNRVLRLLFAGNPTAIEGMNQLALAVRRLEEAELMARRASPENAATTVMVSAIKELKEEQSATQQALLHQILAAVRPEGASSVSTTPSSPALPPVATADGSVACARTDADAALCSARTKHKREAQGDVAYFSSWTNMGDALTYAREELAPQEAASGAAWRIRKFPDGREDKSRDKQWRCYRTLAIAVGLVLKRSDVSTFDDAIALMQTRFETFGSKAAHTPFLKALQEEQRALVSSELERVAATVLFRLRD